MIPESEWTKSMREFIGTQVTTDKGGVLTVTGVVGRNSSGNAIFSLECSVCSKDEELFPAGSITSVKGGLVNGQVPCGCAFNPKWSQYQYATLIKRQCSERGYEFQGFVGKWKGATTYLKLHNLKNGNTWESTNVYSFLNNGVGCPLDGVAKRITTQTEREEQIKEVLKVEGGMFLGWSGVYKNQHSKFHWICGEGHSCETSGNSFLSGGCRCRTCKKIKQCEGGIGYGYYHTRKEDQDNLYIIYFKKGNYIKVGRSFDVKQRLKGLRKASNHKPKEIEILSVYTGKHKEVYDTEQWIHEELTERGFYHEDSEWTVETFDTDCKDVLFKLLEESGLELTSEY